MLLATKVDVPMSVQYLSGKTERTYENKPTVTNIAQDKKRSQRLQGNKEISVKRDRKK